MKTKEIVKELGIEIQPAKRIFAPLESVLLKLDDTIRRIVVLDGTGREYVDREVFRKYKFAIGGALGTHRVKFFLYHDEFIGEIEFFVRAETYIKENSGIFSSLFTIAYYTMIHTVTNSGLFSSDNTFFDKFIYKGQDVENWWYPDTGISNIGIPHKAVAWQGKNKKCGRIGVTALGIDNPFPDKVINDITFYNGDSSNKWFILGITLSDNNVYFKPTELSYGIPDNWGAAAVMYALVEGVAGVIDEYKTFDSVMISPKWISAGVKKSEVCILYPSSNSYVAYTFYHNKSSKYIEFFVTGSGAYFKLRLELPLFIGTVRKVLVNDREINFKIKKNNKFKYIPIDFLEFGPKHIRVYYR